MAARGGLAAIDRMQQRGGNRRPSSWEAGLRPFKGFAANARKTVRQNCKARIEQRPQAVRPPTAVETGPRQEKCLPGGRFEKSSPQCRGEKLLSWIRRPPYQNKLAS